MAYDGVGGPARPCAGAEWRGGGRGGQRGGAVCAAEGSEGAPEDLRCPAKVYGLDPEGSGWSLEDSRVRFVF